MINFTITNPPEGITHKHVFNDRAAFTKWYNETLRPILGGAHFDNDELIYNGGKGYLTEDASLTSNESNAPVTFDDPGTSSTLIIDPPTEFGESHTQKIHVSEPTPAKIQTPKKSIGKKIAEKFTRKKNK